MSGAAGKILPVIVCGGAGTRLWPVSTAEAPKPFHRLLGGESLFQQAVRRVADSDFLPPIVVCGRAHRATAEEQLAALGVRPAAVVLEPCGRGTAPIAAIAAALAERFQPQALVLMLAADHLIPDAQAYRQAVRRGAAVADDHIVVLGIQPTRAETGYGYIKRAHPLSDAVFAVERFVEKPAQAMAEAFLASGDYSWNASAFLFAPRVMREEMAASRPDIGEAALAALPDVIEGTTVELDGRRFRQCPAESLDRAVMERTACAAVVICDFAWADIGAWDEVWRLGEHDEHGNTLHGDVQAVDVRDCLIWSEAPSVAAIGVSDLIIAATRSGVLVAPKARAQEVRAIAEMLAARPAKAE